MQKGGVECVFSVCVVWEECDGSAPEHGARSCGTRLRPLLSCVSWVLRPRGPDPGGGLASPPAPSRRNQEPNPVT